MEHINYKQIGNKLYKLRKYMDLTQAQVADILNIGRDAVIRIEKGNRKININELIKFSKLYNISMEELIEEDSKNMYSQAAFNSGFNNLSFKDKKEILDLIKVKNRIKQNKNNKAMGTKLGTNY